MNTCMHGHWHDTCLLALRGLHLFVVHWSLVDLLQHLHLHRNAVMKVTIWHGFYREWAFKLDFCHSPVFSLRYSQPVGEHDMWMCIEYYYATYVISNVHSESDRQLAELICPSCPSCARRCSWGQLAACSRSIRDTLTRSKCLRKESYIYIICKSHHFGIYIHIVHINLWIFSYLTVVLYRLYKYCMRAQPCWILHAFWRW